jgi:Ca2+-binding RTX toxin-like protein
MANDNGVVSVWPAAIVAGIQVNVLGGNDVVDAGPFIAKPFAIYGGPGNDTLIGSSGLDGIFGEAGDDLLGGRAGNDTLLGGFGNDTIRGDGGMDWMFGEVGDDTLIANDGAVDGIVDGGPGADIFFADAFDPVVP